MDWKRARSDEQKEIRVQQIVDATAKLFDTMHYEQISMATIAKHLEFTRGNLYKYFATKEEILLNVTQRDLQVWVQELQREFESTAPGLPAGEFGRRWAITMLRRPRLLRLLSILYTMLEQNASEEVLAEFKAAFFASMRQVFRVIHRIYPNIGIDDVNELLRMQVAFTAGLFPMSVQSTAQKSALERAGLSYTPPDFVKVYARGVTMFVEGFERRERWDS